MLIYGPLAAESRIVRVSLGRWPTKIWDLLARPIVYKICKHIARKEISMSIQVSHTAISAASKAPTSYIQPSRILKSMLISNNSLSKADRPTNNNPLFQMITRAQPPFTRALMLTTILTKPRISTQLIICLSIRYEIASLASLITTSRKMVE